MLNFNDLSEVWQKQPPAAALHYFYILKENSLILQSAVHAFEYLVCCWHFDEWSLSSPPCWRFAILDRYFQELELVTDSYFVPHRIIHSSKHISSWRTGVCWAKFGFQTLMQLNLAVSSLAAEVIALCACLDSPMFLLHNLYGSSFDS